MYDKDELRSIRNRLQERKDSAESNLRSIKRKIEEDDEEISRGFQHLSERFNDDGPMKLDVQMINIYNERDSLLRSLRESYRDFDELATEEYKREIQQIEDEEAELLATQCEEDEEEEL
ncbi:hypothetical protein SAMN02910298_01945 [Pseudobutyrivibrio sp. YE44]|uniref:hypothetical protein n=1 Tax=Pseudobutyrivibrio sp. YE44 TaxID=1520802 RepID=UPI00088AF9ED|nr:hypothetical protein [Pseudobutyrivibrio sp. YE44]SDB39930.1 hypothetical protein SAMN02910298_01945 [Pseudobutyrivibrio sp. YE44]